jgi:hypothetical protein
MTHAWEQAFEAHRAESLALDPAEFSKPTLALPTYIREANQALQLARECWEHPPEPNAPPLKLYTNFYGPERLERAQSLIHALQHAVGVDMFHATPSNPIGPTVERASFIIQELDAALDFVLEDDIDEPADAQLALLQNETASLGYSAAVVGQLLLSWITLAQSLQDRLATLGDFDPNLLQEGLTLVPLLTGARPPLPAESSAQPWPRLRRALYTLAHREMQALRRIVERAYRHHDATRQRFASAERRRRRTRTTPLTPPTT